MNCGNHAMCIKKKKAIVPLRMCKRTNPPKSAPMGGSLAIKCEPAQELRFRKKSQSTKETFQSNKL